MKLETRTRVSVLADSGLKTHERNADKDSHESEAENKDEGSSIDRPDGIIQEVVDADRIGEEGGQRDDRRRVVFPQHASIFRQPWITSYEDHVS